MTQNKQIWKLYVIIGFCVGMLMLIPWLFTSNPPVSWMKTYELLNTPASLAVEIWRQKLRMPPKGEAAIVVVPMAAIIMQWTTIGLAVGLASKFIERLRQKR
jgi:hypothetical protein